MFGAALVALMVGGPLGACLFLAYGVVHAMKVAKVDAKYAAKGEVPPSYALINRWLDRKKAAGTAPKTAKPAKPGMWRYAWQRWQAMWEDMGLDFTEQREQEEKARAEAKAKGLPVPPRRTAKDKARSLKSWKWWLTGTPENPEQGPAGPQPGSDATAPDPAQPETPGADPSGPRTACEDCGQTLIQRNNTWEHPSSAGCPKTPATTESEGTPMTTDRAARTAAAETEAHQAEQAGDSDEAASIRKAEQHRQLIDHTDDGAAEYARTTDPSDSSAPTGGTTMTQATTTAQQSGEVVGLMSAINYAGAVAAAHEAHSTGGGEGYRASLGQAEVGPETIQTAAAAQELTDMAGAAWRLHEQKLKEQLAAKEATTAETGKKEFLLAE